MNAMPERPKDDMYAQAYEALHHAAAIFVPMLAEAETGLMVILDIGGMGRVNVRYGVPTGDLLLHAVEASLRSTLGGTGEVARLAGDQFLVVIPGEASAECAVGPISDAVKLARVRVRWGRSVRVRANIGTAVWHDKFPPHAALRAAGEALSKVPIREKNCTKYQA